MQCEEERRVDRDLHVRPDHRNRILREGRPRSIPLRSLRTGSSLIIRTMKSGPEWTIEEDTHVQRCCKKVYRRKICEKRRVQDGISCRSSKPIAIRIKTHLRSEHIWRRFVLVQSARRVIIPQSESYHSLPRDSRQARLIYAKPDRVPPLDHKASSTTLGEKVGVYHPRTLLG